MANNAYKEPVMNRRRMLYGAAAVAAGALAPKEEAKADGPIEFIVNGAGNAAGGIAGCIFKAGGGVLKAGGDIVNGGVAIIGGATKAVTDTAGGLINGAGKLLEDYVKDGWEYGAIDNYINKETMQKGDMEKILFGLTHYPADFLFDIGRAFEAAFGKVPEEAMSRAKEEKAAYIKKHGKKKVQYGPLAMVWNASEKVVEFANDCGRYVWKYGGVSLEGSVEQVTKRPLETAVHGFWTWFFTYISSQHGNGGGGIGGESKPPGAPPKW